MERARFYLAANQVYVVGKISNVRKGLGLK
jgi:hypothetical protein